MEPPVHRHRMRDSDLCSLHDFVGVGLAARRHGDGEKSDDGLRKKNCKLVPESDQNGVFEDVQSSPTENFASPAVLAP